MEPTLPVSGKPSETTQPHSIEIWPTNTTSSIQLLDLPQELLVQIASNLPYQSTSRFLACCRLLRGLITPEQLVAIKSRTRSEMLVGEVIMMAMRKKEGWCSGMPLYSGTESLPCYTCVDWLVGSHDLGPWYFLLFQKWILNILRKSSLRSCEAFPVTF